MLLSVQPGVQRLETHKTPSPSLASMSPLMWASSLEGKVG